MTRVFDGGPSSEEIEQVAALALRAPTAGFSQGVHLLVLADADLQTFWDRSGAGAWFGERAVGVLQSTHVILVFGDAREYVERYSLDDKRALGLDSQDRWSTPFWIVDAAMVAENVLLLAEERRWGALFFGVHGDQTEYFDALEVPRSAHCIGAIALGYRSRDDAPSGSPTTRARRDQGEVLHFGTWHG